MLKDNIAKKLEEKSNKLAKDTLASKAGISQVYFSQLMNGVIKNPGVYTIDKIAKTLNCSIDDLLGRNVQNFKIRTKQNYTKGIKFQSKLALSVAMALLTSLEKHKQAINFEEFLELMAAIYGYSVSKNSETADKDLVDWFVKYFISSKEE